MTRFHEDQRFRGRIVGLILAALIFVVAVALGAIVLARPDDAWLLAVAPVLVLIVAALILLSHLDVDVADEGVRIAFRFLWPTRRIRFEEIVGLQVRRYRPLLEYGGWGVRLGPAGWAYSTGGDEGVQLRLRKGIPVLIGSKDRVSSRPRSAPGWSR